MKKQNKAPQADPNGGKGMTTHRMVTMAVEHDFHVHTPPKPMKRVMVRVLHPLCNYRLRPGDEVQMQELQANWLAAEGKVQLL